MTAALLALLLAAAQPDPPPACDKVAGIELVTAAAKGRRFVVTGEVHGTVQAGVIPLPDATTGWNATHAFGEPARPSPPTAPGSHTDGSRRIAPAAPAPRSG